jgi:hypothetical protein
VNLNFVIVILYDLGTRASLAVKEGDSEVFWNVVAGRRLVFLNNKHENI